MFQNPTVTHNFKISAKRKFVLFVSSAIAATGLISVTAIPASAAPVTKLDYGLVYRQVTNNEFTLKANETLSVALRSSVTSFTSDGTKQLSSNMAVTPGIAGVTYGSKSYNWTISGTVGGSSCNQNLSTQIVTPCSSATNITYSVFQNLTNTTGSPITITTNSATAQLTYGADAVTGVTNIVDAHRFVTSSSPEMTSGLVVGAGDRSIYGPMTLCIDSAQVVVGDVLTFQKSAAISGTALADSRDGSNPYLVIERNGSALADITLTAPIPTQIMLQIDSGNLSSTLGTLAISVDLKKGGTSVLKACPAPSGGGGGTPVPLFSLGGASVSGTFAAGQVITATPNSWSRTNGGAAVTTTNSFDWLVCTQSQATSTTRPQDVPCIEQESGYQFILADGNSIGGFNNGQSVFYSAATLTITQNLLNLLNGKHLMVVTSGTASNPTARSNVFMQTCGPISAGSTCSVAFGTAPPVVGTPPGAGTNTSGGTQGTGTTTTALPAQTLAKAIPAKAKAGKPITIAAATKSKVAVKVKVAGKGCKVAPVKDKKKKIVSYKVTMGKKGATCTVTVTAPATSTVAALKSVTKIKAS